MFMNSLKCSKWWGGEGINKKFEKFMEGIRGNSEAGWGKLKKGKIKNTKIKNKSETKSKGKGYKTLGWGREKIQ